MPRTPLLESEREAVATACRRLAAAGLVRGTSGNVSARRDDLVAVTATGGELARLEADQVTVVDLEGTVVAGDHAPTSELDLHLGVYERYDAGAVVHTHAPAATAIACVLDELPCVHYELLALGGPVRVAPYATYGTPELAAGVLDALEGRTAALMANHGTLAYAADLDGAVAATELLEWASELYRLAASVGTPRVLDAAELEAVAAHSLAIGYGKLRPA